MKMTIIPASKGSVGSATPNPPSESFSKLIESGVKKTMRKNTNSTLKNAAQIIKATRGNKAK